MCEEISGSVNHRIATHSGVVNELPRVSPRKKNSKELEDNKTD